MDLSVCSINLCKEILRQAQNDKFWFFGWGASVLFLIYLRVMCGRGRSIPMRCCGRRAGVPRRVGFPRQNDSARFESGDDVPAPQSSKRYVSLLATGHFWNVTRHGPETAPKRAVILSLTKNLFAKACAEDGEIPRQARDDTLRSGFGTMCPKLSGSQVSLQASLGHSTGSKVRPFGLHLFAP